MKLSKSTKLKEGVYEILETLGQGGFGITYKAKWNNGPAFIEYVALKEFFLSDICERKNGSTIQVTSSAHEKFEDFKSRLKKEAFLLHEFRHPNIVEVYDVFEENNTVYVAMEYIEGKNLKDKIDGKGKLSPAESFKYIREIGDALQFIHDKNAVHLDVKPSNIMIETNGKAKLIDFGIAKQYNESDIKTHLTSTLIGYSDGFAPIEQYDTNKKIFKPNSDVYALAATFYYCITGEVPPSSIKRTSKEEILTKPTFINKKMYGIIEHGMAIRPDDRYQSITEFIETLEKTVDTKNLRSKPLPEQKYEQLPEQKEQDTQIAGEEKEPLHPRKPKSSPKSNFPTSGKYLTVGFIVLLTIAAAAVLFRVAMPCYYYSQGEKRLNNEQYDEAAACFQKAVDMDYPQAMVALGDMYRDSLGIEGNCEKAFLLYTQAAGKDYAKAQTRLGNMYRDSLSVKSDYQKAMEWYLKAASRNDLDAMVNIGNIYLDSIRWKYPDESKAKEWFQKAIDLDYVRGFTCMGAFFEYKKDYAEALKYYQKADSLGYVQASWHIGNLYLNDSSGIEKDYQKALSYYEKIAEKHSAKGAYLIAGLYLDSTALGLDYEKALFWLNEAAKPTPVQNRIWANKEAAASKNGKQSDIIAILSAGETEATISAKLKTGKMYYKGEGVDKDTVTAEKWFNKTLIENKGDNLVSIGNIYKNEKNYAKAKEYYEKALELKTPYSYRRMGDLYHYGYGVKKDYKKAMEYYQEGVTTSDAGNCYNQLGRLFYDGEATVSDYPKAIGYFTKGMELKDASSYHLMGNIYCSGYGVKKDYKKAMEYYKKAFEIGCCGNEAVAIGYMYRDGEGVEQNYKEAAKWFQKGIDENRRRSSYAMYEMGKLYRYGQGVKKDETEAKRLFNKAITEALVIDDEGDVIYWARSELATMK